MTRNRPPDQPARILDAAELLFAELGIRYTTVADVANRARVAPATVYHYFENKEALFGWTIVRAWEPDVAVPIELPLSAPTDLRTRVWDQAFDLKRQFPRLHAAARRPTFSAEELGALVAETFEVNVRLRRLIDLLEASRADDEDLWALYRDAVHDPLFALRRRYLAAGQRAGRIASHLDVDVLAEIFAVNVGFYARVWRRQFPVLELDDDARLEVLTERLRRAIES